MLQRRRFRKILGFEKHPREGRLIYGLFNCGLIDAYKAAARRGDPAAIEALCRLAPRDAPPAERKRARNERIRSLALFVETTVHGASAHQIARLLALAGSVIESGRSLDDVAAFEIMSPGERALLSIEVRAILAWLPMRRSGRRWLRWRQIASLIHE